MLQIEETELKYVQCACTGMSMSDVIANIMILILKSFIQTVEGAGMTIPGQVAKCVRYKVRGRYRIGNY